MNKRGRSGLVILGVPVAFLFWWFLIGSAVESGLSEALDALSASSVCPNEFKTSEFQVCFTKDGDVVAEGKFSEKVTVEIEGFGNSCVINSGQYSFEYSGCRLDKFKQAEAYNLVLITREGKVLLKSEAIAKKILAGAEIVNVAPKGVRILRQIMPAIRILKIL